MLDAMTLKSIRDYSKEWELNAKIDPYWAILTDPEKIGAKWNPRDFFATGLHEISTLIAYMKALDLAIDYQGTCVDFGCGLGRVSQALSKYFGKVIGIDISQNMLTQARLLSKDVEFICNQTSNLQSLPDASVDFIYSNIVLQHMNWTLQKSYIEEFGRILKKGGWAVFQIPSQKMNIRSLAKNLVKTVLPYSVQKLLLKWIKKEHFGVEGIRFEMHRATEKKVLMTAKRKGLHIKHLTYSNSIASDFNGNLQFFSKKIAKSQSQNMLSPFYFFQKESEDA